MRAWFKKTTPLHSAAAKGHLSVVEVLIKSHSDVNTVDEVSQCSEYIVTNYINNYKSQYKQKASQVHS